MNISDVRARLVALAALLTTATLVALPGASAAHGAARWAPADSATITPGVQMMTKGAQCTANFVYTDGAGRTYVGYAAHCAGKGEATDTDGCSTASYPLGTRVTFVAGESLATAGQTLGRGTLAYSSWITMHKAGTKNANTCAYNDLALVRVDAKDVK